ncbi:MAG: hypothetical protein A2X08_08565 [Bacteroidetes bacterium GWA2_32_17]|nr:MAG: hypothetical protein A2X08_08565 [Bacteroidetes bacterium GWA2_32_17]
MKNLKFAFVLVVFAITASYFTSCKKDKFTEEDAINLQAAIDANYARLQDSLLKVGGVIHYSVNVVSVGNAAKSIGSTNATGATVSAIQNGGVLTVTTGADGIAVFDNMRIGNVTVNVQLAGHSAVDFIADLTPANNITGPGQDLSQTTRLAATLIPMFPTSGATMATVNGKVTYESNLINNTREFPTSAVVICAIDVTSPLFTDFTTPTGGTINQDQAGRIINIVYSDFSSNGVADASGNYSLQVPATATGLPIKLAVSDYTTNQSLLLSVLNGQNVDGVQSIRTMFGSNFTPSNIPSVLPAYVTVGAPTGAIGAYTNNATLGAVTVIAGTVTNIAVNTQGLGYTNTPDVVITSPDPYATGATAIAILNGNGEVTAINITNGGSGYITANAVLNINTFNTTAKAVVTSNVNGNITGITVTNSGKGYITKPSVTITASVTGLGTGATAVSSLNNPSNGQINIQLTNGGTGYTGKNYITGAGDGVAVTPGGTTFNVVSGTTVIKDVYLGTGKREIEN